LCRHFHLCSIWKCFLGVQTGSAAWRSCWLEHLSNAGMAYFDAVWWIIDSTQSDLSGAYSTARVWQLFEVPFHMLPTHTVICDTKLQGRQKCGFCSWALVRADQISWQGFGSRTSFDHAPKIFEVAFLVAKFLDVAWRRHSSHPQTEGCESPETLFAQKEEEVSLHSTDAGTSIDTRSQRSWYYLPDLLLYLGLSFSQSWQARWIFWP